MQPVFAGIPSMYRYALLNVYEAGITRLYFENYEYWVVAILIWALIMFVADPGRELTRAGRRRKRQYCVSMRTFSYNIYRVFQHNLKIH